ncbi:MAG TPA: hypothetical protein VK429_00220 [Patescibacteria group bacterium]|nr:hypothetical protein [Patescibacteria group bacterium]
MEGTVLITVSERDRAGALEAARRFAALGFSIVATAAAIATAKGISAHRLGHADVRSLQQYHAGIGG